MNFTRIFCLSLITLISATNAGCTHRYLRYDHVMQAKSLTTIYEQQVLDNLAMFAQNSSSLPFFAIPGGGTATVNDSGGISAGPLNGPVRTVIGPLGLNRGNVQSWTLIPVTDSAKLERMQVLYQNAIDAGVASRASGRRRPNAECNLKGSYCDSNIQVCAENRAAFTRLVLDVLNAALKDPTPAPSEPTVEVQDYIYNTDATVKEIRKYTVKSSTLDLNRTEMGSVEMGAANIGTGEIVTDNLVPSMSGSSSRRVLATPSEAIAPSVIENRSVGFLEIWPVCKINVLAFGHRTVEGKHFLRGLRFR